MELTRDGKEESRTTADEKLVLRAANRFVFV
jgi:hypothetical protein